MPLHVEVIWERMEAKGVRSDAKRPVGFVAMIAGKNDEIEKAGPSTYRWVAPSSEHSNNAKESASS